MGVLIKVADKKDIPEGRAIVVTVNGKPVALFNINGQYYAIDDTCTHEGGPLSEGNVEGTKVTCPWHGAEFNLTNGEVLGEALGEPLPNNVQSYKVYIEGEEIKIEA